MNIFDSWWHSNYLLKFGWVPAVETTFRRLISFLHVLQKCKNRFHTFAFLQYCAKYLSNLEMKQTLHKRISLFFNKGNNFSL